jgi:hypothetical protein
MNVGQVPAGVGGVSAHSPEVAKITRPDLKPGDSRGRVAGQARGPRQAMPAHDGRPDSVPNGSGATRSVRAGPTSKASCTDSSVVPSCSTAHFAPVASEAKKRTRWQKPSITSHPNGPSGTTIETTTPAGLTSRAPLRSTTRDTCSPVCGSVASTLTVLPRKAGMRSVSNAGQSAIDGHRDLLFGRVHSGHRRTDGLGQPLYRDPCASIPVLCRCHSASSSNCNLDGVARGYTLGASALVVLGTLLV